MARPKKTDAKTVGGFTVSTDAKGVQHVKVAGGKTTKTSTGKTAKGGQIVTNVASPSLVKKTKRASKEVFDSFDDIDELDDDYGDEYGVENIPTEADLEDAVQQRLYVTRDGIVGDAEADGLHVIDTTGIDDEGIYEISLLDPEDRETRAAELRNERAFSTKHYFNDTGDYGHVKDLKIIDAGELTRAELRAIHSSDDPFTDADDYDTSSFTVLSANRNVKRYGHSGNFDDLNNDELISEGVSY